MDSKPAEPAASEKSGPTPLEAQFRLDEAKKKFIAENKERLGAKKAKKVFHRLLKEDMLRHQQDRVSKELWDLSTYNPNCKNHCDRGINGRLLIGKDEKGEWIRTEVVCTCVKPMPRPDEQDGGEAPAPSGCNPDGSSILDPGEEDN